MLSKAAVSMSSDICHCELWIENFKIIKISDAWIIHHIVECGAVLSIHTLLMDPGWLAWINVLYLQHFYH